MAVYLVKEWVIIQGIMLLPLLPFPSPTCTTGIRKLRKRVISWAIEGLNQTLSIRESIKEVLVLPGRTAMIICQVLFNYVKA